MYLRNQLLFTLQYFLFTLQYFLFTLQYTTIHTHTYIHNCDNLFYVYFVGFIMFAIISLYCYFWFLYTLHLFLRVANPIRMVKLEQSKYSRMIHITEVTIAVLLGTVPYIFFAIYSKFHIATFPPLYCGTDPVYYFYGTILPTVLVSCATLIMMLFVLYKIHIVSHVHPHNNIMVIACICVVVLIQVCVLLEYIVIVYVYATFPCRSLLLCQMHLSAFHYAY